jgi:mono/diheme cytochrome c family protein
MRRLHALLFPDPPRTLPHARAWNIACRTAHLAATGVLLGGHAFDVSEARLRLALHLSLATGLGLIFLEAYPSCRWFCQGRGVLVLLKLGLLGLVPFFWEYRLALLLTIVVIASVGSHMPSRFRYFSLVHGRVLGERAKDKAPPPALRYDVCDLGGGDTVPSKRDEATHKGGSANMGRAPCARTGIVDKGAAVMLAALAAAGLVYVATMWRAAPVGGTTAAPRHLAATQPLAAAADPTEVPDQAAPPADPVALGAKLFETHCAACHGTTGDGQGLAARFLYPRPRNFLDGKFRLVTSNNRIPTDDDLLRVITRGMPGSAMFPFGHLSDGERRALVAHVRLLTRKGVEARLRKAAADSGEDADAEQIAADVKRLTEPDKVIDVPALAQGDLLARGKLLYNAQCATCHGETGKGDGGKEQKDDDGTPTRPRDLTRGIFKGSRDRDQLYARVLLGLPGSPMPASPHLKPEEIDGLVAYVQSFSSPEVQALVEHKRQTLAARRTTAKLGDDIPAAVWEAAPAAAVVLSPLWWREYAEPGLRVQAVHDGETLAVRLTWKDGTRNGLATRVDEFEDMAAVQLYKGKAEPFLGMGADGAPADLWLWRAGSQRDLTAMAADHQLDDYPLDTSIYKRFANGKPPADLQTARAAGNQHATREGSASNLTAGGFTTTTFRPKPSQKVSARAEWRDGAWSVVLRRPLRVGTEDGYALAPGDTCSVAFAVWDGAARDRNGQKLVSIWHDLMIE